MTAEELKKVIKEAVLEALRERDREKAELAFAATERMTKKQEAAGQNKASHEA